MRIKYEQVAFVDVPKSGMFADLKLCMSEETLLLTIQDIKDIHYDVIDEPEMYEEGMGEFLSGVLERLDRDDFTNKIFFQEGW
jgi:hypothetical protein